MSNAVTKTQSASPNKFRETRGKCGSATKSVARLISVARGILTGTDVRLHAQSIALGQCRGCFRTTPVSSSS